MVQALDAAARTAGIRVGMPLARAQIQVPGLQTRPADPAGDVAALTRLALWVQARISPLVAVDASGGMADGIVIDSTGADHLHGGEAAMLDTLLGQLARAGITARAALADTWGAAHALARHAPQTGPRPAVIAPPGQGGTMIAPLPLVALRLPAEMGADLRRLGLTRIADLAAQPRAPLTRRFGPELLRRLDQAQGRLAEPFDPVRPPDILQVRRGFVEPISTAPALAQAIAVLADALCATLTHKGLGARRLDLLCRRVDRDCQAVRIGTAQPIRDPGRLCRLLGEKIETIAPGFGIETMTLIASVTDPLAPTQITTDLAAPPEADLADLIDTLTNRFGAAAVYRAAPVASDVPERSVRRIPALAADTGARWPAAWPRPARLLPVPEMIETVALLPDHPPAFFTWRGVRRRVARADGPERIFGEWWKRDAELTALRDYFRVEDETGERYWIYRAGDGEHRASGSQHWFLHGVFG